MKKWTILWLSGLMGLAVGPHALSAAVSYTHLTLPTICSV